MNLQLPKILMVIVLMVPLRGTIASGSFINNVDTDNPDPLISDIVTGTFNTPRLANGITLEKDMDLGTAVQVTWWGGNAFDPTGTIGTPNPLDFGVIYSGGSIFSPTPFPNIIIQEHFANSLSPTGTVNVIPASPLQSSVYNEYRTTLVLDQDLSTGSSYWIEIVDRSASTAETNQTAFHWLAGVGLPRDVRLATRNTDSIDSWNILTPTHLGRAFTFIAVPEPSSLSLVGLLGIGFMKRRIRRTCEKL